jgi:hypothetical protein
MTSLLETIDARIADCKGSQEMFRQEYNEGVIGNTQYKEFYGRIGLRIDELEQVREKVVEIVKELEAKRDQAEIEAMNEAGKSWYRRDDAKIENLENRADAYVDGLNLIRKVDG